MLAAHHDTEHAKHVFLVQWAGHRLKHAAWLTEEQVPKAALQAWHSQAPHIAGDLHQREAALSPTRNNVSNMPRGTARSTAHSQKRTTTARHEQKQKKQKASQCGRGKAVTHEVAVLMKDQTLGTVMVETEDTLADVRQMVEKQLAQPAGFRMMRCGCPLNHQWSVPLHEAQKHKKALPFLGHQGGARLMISYSNGDDDDMFCREMRLL